MTSGAVLEVRNLHVEFASREGPVYAVNGVSFDVFRGEVLGVVGESGSGKSVTGRSVLGIVENLGLVETGGRITAGEILFEGVDILRMSTEDRRRLAGNRIAMIFQDPMDAFNPVVRVGVQIREAIRIHDRQSGRDEARRRSKELLKLVGIPEPEARYRAYPHEYSGGMLQRAMIAMAIANQPDVLIADEPTTALDVTVQAQILEVLQLAQRERRSGMVLVTHDLGVIAELADRVVVMYAGKIMESGPVDEIFHDPRHPYTVGLLNSIPRTRSEERRLTSIPGQPPSALTVTQGCPYVGRCGLADGRLSCQQESPPLQEVGRRHFSACHYTREVADWRRRTAPGPPS